MAIMRRKPRTQISRAPQQAVPNKSPVISGAPPRASTKKPTVVSGKIGATTGNRAVQSATAAEGTRIAEAGRAVKQPTSARQPTVAGTRAVLSGTAARQPRQPRQSRVVSGQLGAANNPNARAATPAKAMPRSRSLVSRARQMVASSRKKV